MSPPPHDRQEGAPPRDCQEVRALMLTSAEEDLAPADARRVEGHVDSCAACRDALADTRKALTGWPLPLPDAADWQQVARAIEAATGTRLVDATEGSAAPGRESAPRSGWLRRGSVAAAVTVTAVGLIWLVVSGLDPRNGPGGNGPTGASDLVAFEVTGLPPDQVPDIYFGDDEPGVLVMITSD